MYWTCKGKIPILSFACNYSTWVMSPVKTLKATICWAHLCALSYVCLNYSNIYYYYVLLLLSLFLHWGASEFPDCIRTSLTPKLSCGITFVITFAPQSSFEMVHGVTGCALVVFPLHCFQWKLFPGLLVVWLSHQSAVEIKRRDKHMVWKGGEMA